ncbi:hypothetical protein [Acanthopleuribacter pedis]|uniref:Uncharacterized protein n=1 Tax=Acanthopleuribacter pedis TaxID=442870 RepID=A0A8J7U5Y7_9BACT|nr:hypothetical protein [Acanthopleuribacter pedis]MBO1320968.1 hypothetical protein [Acanthopleuribacter pedis]
MKKFVCFVMIAALLVPLAPAADHDRIAKDIRILYKILKSSFGDDDRHHRRHHDDGELRPHRINHTYLDGQGVVFIFDMGGSRHHYRHFSRINVNVPPMVIPPVPPIYVPNGEEDEEALREQYREMMESYQEVVEEVAEHAAEAVEDAAETLGEVGNLHASREIETEMRRIREEQRRVSKEIRRVALETRRQMINKKKMTEQERKELIERLEGFKTKVETDVKQYLVKAEKLREVQSKEYLAKYAVFEGQLAEAMCEFGASVDIPDSEYINIIVSRAGERGKDKIYVFRKTDLNQCRNDQITKSGLLEKAKVYEFE